MKRESEMSWEWEISSEGKLRFFNVDELWWADKAHIYNLIKYAFMQSAYSVCYFPPLPHNKGKI